MEKYKNYLFFGLFIGFFILLDISGCGKAHANDLDSQVIDQQFHIDNDTATKIDEPVVEEYFNNEIELEINEINKEFLLEEEVLEPSAPRNPAQELIPAPEVFKDSDIVRTLKDGTSQKFDGDEYMIVRRVKNKSPKKQPKTVVQYVEVEKVVKESRKKRISAFVGHGPTDRLNVQYRNDGSAVVRNSAGMVGTVQYQQVFHRDGWNWGAQLQTNETISLGIGKDF